MKKPSKPKSAKALKDRKLGKLPKVTAVVPQVAQRWRKPTLQEQTEEALSNVPRITNETVAEHREEVLKGARKYKYPLEHSKHKIVIISSTLLATALIGFVSYTLVDLYKFQSTSQFMYNVTKIVPFPVAKADKRWVSYESYLFELKRYMHYYETQQQVDFTSKSGKFQLDTYKPKAMQQVVDDAYVKQLASQHGVSVSSRDVDDAIAMLRAQNQLGSNNDELASVTKKFFGWSIDDLRRQLKQELLAQKVAAKLDTASYKRAENVLAQVKNGADFAALASQQSDDTATKTNGGQYNDTAISANSQEVPAAVVRELAKLQPGQTSGIITTATSFEIVKLISVENGKYKAAHIQVLFKDIQNYLQPLEKEHPAKKFIKVELPK